MDTTSIALAKFVGKLRERFESRYIEYVGNSFAHTSGFFVQTRFDKQVACFDFPNHVTRTQNIAVVTGKSGGGKTTFCEQLCAQQCCEKALLFRVPLTKIFHIQIASISDLLLACANNYLTRDETNAIVAEKIPIMWLIDDFDQVRCKNDSSIVHFLNNFVDLDTRNLHLQNSTLPMLIRPCDHVVVVTQDGKLSGTNCDLTSANHFSVQNWNDDEWKSFCTKWLSKFRITNDKVVVEWVEKFGKEHISPDFVHAVCKLYWERGTTDKLKLTDIQREICHSNQKRMEENETEYHDRETRLCEEETRLREEETRLREEEKRLQEEKIIQEKKKREEMKRCYCNKITYYIMNCDETNAISALGEAKDNGFLLNNEMEQRTKKTLLHRAAEYSLPNVIVYLLVVCFFDVNARDSDDCTPLHLAAMSRRNNALECMEILLDEECCNVNAISSNGDTPLDILLASASVGNADQYKRAQIVDLFLSYGNKKKQTKNSIIEEFRQKLCAHYSVLFASKYRYIPQQLNHLSIPNGQNETIISSDLSSRINNYKKVVIIKGDCGIGKTALCHQLCIEQKSETGLTIFVSLPELIDAPIESVYELLKKCANDAFSDDEMQTIARCKIPVTWILDGYNVIQTVKNFDFVIEFADPRTRSLKMESEKYQYFTRNCDFVVVTLDNSYKNGSTCNFNSSCCSCCNPCVDYWELTPWNSDDMLRYCSNREMVDNITGTLDQMGVKFSPLVVQMLCKSRLEGENLSNDMIFDKLTNLLWERAQQRIVQDGNEINFENLRRDAAKYVNDFVTLKGVIGNEIMFDLSDGGIVPLWASIFEKIGLLSFSMPYIARFNDKSYVEYLTTQCSTLQKTTKKLG